MERIKKEIKIEQFDILIIDNREISRNATFNILTHAGYKVDTAIHGKDGIEKLKLNQFSYKLVLTELIMPYAGGFEVIKFLKANSSVPIIILSAISDEKTIYSIFNNDADDFIKKPFITGELKQRISKLISLNYNFKMLDSNTSSQKEDAKLSSIKIEHNETSEEDTLTKLVTAKKTVKKSSVKNKNPAKKTASKKVVVKKAVKPVKKDTGEKIITKKKVVKKKALVSEGEGKIPESKSPKQTKIKSVLIG